MNTKRLLRNAVVGVGAAGVVLATVIVTRPSIFHVERSAVVAAPPDAVFARVNDLHAWSTWSPYEKLDPHMAKTFEGPRAGAGATYAWKGNDKIGEGRMAIVESERPSRVALKLDFIKPFACTNTASFTFLSTPEGTKVTWAMDGQNTFVGKALSLVVDMDKLVGGDFERGLAALKSQSESASTARAETATN